MENKIMDTYLKPKKRPLVSIFFSKILLSLILFFASLIFVNINSFCKENYKKYVFDNTFNFMNFRNLYNKVVKNKKEEQLVFGEDLKYLNIEKTPGKEIITLYNTDMIKTISSGIVVFVGEKEDFGNTVIVQGADGYDIWYGNLESYSLNLYDYVKSSSILGNVKDNKLFLEIVKDGEELSYEEYQNKN